MKSYQTSNYKGEFFKIITQTNLSQVGVMTLKKDQSSGGSESHSGDQIVIVLEGEGKAILNGQEITLVKNSFCIIPAQTKHTIINTSDSDLFFISVYTPVQY